MWKCHKCGKPVYFAERMQSLGYDWHPGCLRCEECGKRLNPGQHAEHKGMPYCHVPCYGALFGPQLFGHGTRVESHKSFGGVKTIQPAAIATGNGPSLPRDHLESKLKVYNQFYDNKSLEIRSREVNNRLILEGALRVYWGVQGVIHLKEDDDQRTFVVRKRNSCRVSKAAADDSLSDKENEMSESLEGTLITSEVDGMSTDISLSESITFDSCSPNEFNELPTTPEDVSANTTGNYNPLVVNGNKVEDSDDTESSSTLCCQNEDTLNTATSSCVSSSLPSKLDKLKRLEWDEIDELLQVERRVSEKDKVYETMPSKLPSTSSASSSDNSSKTASPFDSTNSINGATDVALPSSSTNDKSTGSNDITSSDQFMTATENTTDAAASSTVTTSVETFEYSDDATLKPMDFEDFKRSVHQDYVTGANSFQQPNDDTLKKNQPIDPSRIHDSLKLYGDTSVMSKSFNCENELRSINSKPLNESGDSKNLHMQRFYALQKSGSATNASSKHKDKTYQQRSHYQLFEKGINRSKSGPSCFDLSDSDYEDSDTSRSCRPSNTVRRSVGPRRFIKIEMDCYPKSANNDGIGQSEGESSLQADEPSYSTTNSGAFAGDELTETTGEMLTASSNGMISSANGDDKSMHVTEDGVVLRRPPRWGATAIKRRSGNRRSRTKLKRRCSINGHFYNRETSFFTPPYGSQMSVWVTSLVNTQDVINLVLEKYKVDSPPENFSLFIIRDNGEQKRVKDTDYPLITRVMLGPHEDVARLFLVEKKTDEISNEVAQFINLSIPECRAILERYDQELEREIAKVKEKYTELRRRITIRMESLKVHL